MLEGETKLNHNFISGQKKPFCLQEKKDGTTIVSFLRVLLRYLAELQIRLIKTFYQ